MDAAPAASQLDGMLKVQHLVVHDVFHGTARDGKMVKDAADDDRIVCGIVVPQDAASSDLTPTHAWPRHQSVKKTRIQIFEDSVEIVEVTLRRAQPLVSAHLPDQVGLAHNVMAGDVSAVAGGVAAIDGLAIHLGQQNVGNRANYVLWRAFEQVRKPYQKPALA